MSINIPSSVTQYCDASQGIKLVVDTSKFGPKQRSALSRFLKTGILTNSGVPAMIAESMRNAESLPTVRFGRYDRIHWANVPYDCMEFFEALRSAASVMILEATTVDDWRYRYANDMVVAANNRSSNGWGFLEESARTLFLKKFTFPEHSDSHALPSSLIVTYHIED